MITTDQETISELKFQLSDLVPDMIHGFTIVTNYGGIIEIEPDFAEPIRKITNDVLQYRLAKLRTL
jgi:hypothetical protein